MVTWFMQNYFLLCVLCYGNCAYEDNLFLWVQLAADYVSLSDLVLLIVEILCDSQQQSYFGYH